MIRLELDPNGDTVTLRLLSYLGGDRFQAYRDACAAAGARFVPAERVNRAAVSAVVTLLNELKKAELPVEVDERLAARIRDEADEAKQLLDAGKQRIEAAQKRLEASGLALYRFQETGIEWLAPRDRALLCDEMGLGKTVQALIALPEDAAALVVVPSAVRASWEREIARWRPDLSATVCKSKSTFRWPRLGEVLLTSYGCLPEATTVKDEATGKKRTEIEVSGLPEVGTVLIADEAHLVKNPKAKRTQSFRALADHVVAYQGKTWGVTGTPLLNRPPELWSILRTFRLAEESVGTWYQFLGLFHGRKGRYGYEWGEPDDSVPDKLRAVSLRRRRLDVLKDLPGKRRTDRIVNQLDAATIALCDKVVDAMREQGIDLADVSQKVELTRIHGPAFEQLSAARAALAAAKIPALLELVESYEEAEEPLVVFSAHRAPIEALGAREGWAIILGNTSPDERGRIVERFQRGELKGVAGSIQAMGVGVTLTRSHHVLFVDLAWTPALNSQAEDRVCRIGQEAAGVFVERLIARHALDERVCELLTAKQVVFDGSVEASSVEEDYRGSSPAEALARAAESVAGNLVDLDAARKAEEEQQRACEAETRKRVIASLGSQYDGREIKVSPSGKLRSAANAIEDHAARALIQLATFDPDHATEVNNVGFSKLDNEFGHSLARQIEDREGLLSEKQWACAIKLAHKYRRQVGEPSKTVSVIA